MCGAELQVKHAFLGSARDGNHQGAVHPYLSDFAKALGRPDLYFLAHPVGQLDRPFLTLRPLGRLFFVFLGRLVAPIGWRAYIAGCRRRGYVG